MTEGVRGLPRGGDPATFHSLEEWARTGPSRRLQAASRRPRPTSLAMMGRRVVERRHVVKKWWAPSTNAAPRVSPRRIRILAGAVRARSKRESQRGLETRAARKGKRRVARRAPDIDVDRRGSPGEWGYLLVEPRTGRRHRRGRGLEARSVVPARRIRLQNSFSFVVAVRTRRKAESRG
jgi:hypothetical protein